MTQSELVPLDGVASSLLRDSQMVTPSVSEIDSQLDGGMARDASDLAAAAATRSGVTVRHLASVDDMNNAVDLFDAVWHPTDGSSIMNVELLQALNSTGSYVAGVFDGEAMLGACAAIWGRPIAHTLHSHITGVLGSARGRDIGFALKLHQRAWAIKQHVQTITWTFDPLVRRNAYFNITKLGGFARTYYVNHYGPMRDALNGNDDSDRLKLEWDITKREVGAVHSRDLSTVQAVLEVGPGDVPERSGSNDPMVFVGIPADTEAIRQAAPDLAMRWRRVMRETLLDELSQGGRIDAFDHERGGYIVTRGQHS